MSEPSKAKSMLMGFFTIVGIIVAGGFVLIVTYGIYAVTSHKSAFRERESTPLVKTLPKAGEESATPPVYTFGRPEKMGDFMLSRLSIARKSKFSGLSSDSSYYGWGKTINYLFLDPASGKSHWLWQQPLPLVLGEHPYLLRADRDKTANVKEKKDLGLLVSLVEKDTNFDGKLDDEDELTLAVIKPDGKTVLHLLKNLTRISSVTPVDENRALLIYEREGKTYSAMYAPKDYAISLEQDIPQIVIQ